PCSAGYGPLNKEPFIGRALESRGFRSIYGDKVIAEWAERNQCPENDKLCQEACWFTQTMLLGSRSDMDDIAAAIRKIRKHGAGLRNAEAGV
ncbi:MAG TPA: DegT/DnrJ/EryC1/StrS family aminotransferase, partial [Acidobacteriota bacterium]|nr:DegT/DnrJ/EryC1/StrS family aminotransferase [Acidobacteriota bacterium]